MPRKRKAEKPRITVWSTLIANRDGGEKGIDINVGDIGVTCEPRWGSLAGTKPQATISWSAYQPKGVAFVKEFAEQLRLAICYAEMLDSGYGAERLHDRIQDKGL